MNESTISIEKIMAEIEQAAAGMKQPHMTVSGDCIAANIEHLSILQSEIRGYLHTMIRTKDSTAVKPIPPASGPLGFVISIIRRIIRKLTLWLIEPAWEEQKRFNNALTASLSRLAEANDELLRGIKYLSEKKGE